MSKVKLIHNAASTSTGSWPSSTQSAVHLGAVTRVSAALVLGSTKEVSWRLQGSIAGSGAWQNLNAAATTTTGGASPAIVHSTATGVWTQVRVTVTATSSTGAAADRWWVVGV